MPRSHEVPSQEKRTRSRGLKRVDTVIQPSQRPEVFPPLNQERIAQDGREFARLFVEEFTPEQRIAYVGSRALRLGGDPDQPHFFTFLEAAQENSGFSEKTLDAIGNAMQIHNDELGVKVADEEDITMEDGDLLRGFTMLIAKFPLDETTLHDGIHNAADVLTDVANEARDRNVALSQDLVVQAENINNILHPEIVSFTLYAAELFTAELLMQKGFRLFQGRKDGKTVLKGNLPAKALFYQVKQLEAYIKLNMVCDSMSGRAAPITIDDVGQRIESVSKAIDFQILGRRNS